MLNAGIFVSAAIGLSAGNFIHQAMASQNWAVAIERTVFQLAALVCVGIALAVASYSQT